MTDLLEYTPSNVVDSDSFVVPRSPGILIVDDMGLILTMLKFALEPHGFSVWLANDGEDAIELFERHRSEIDLVLLDVQMPGLDGRETLAAIHKIQPGFPACFMTGLGDLDTEADLRNLGAMCVFKKPFRAVDVAQAITRVVHRR